jgi:hypothetical protein
LVGKLETHNVETVSELFALADKYAREAEAHARVERWVPPRNPWRVTIRIPAPRRTSERLPLSGPKQEKNDLQLGYVSS